MTAHDDDPLADLPWREPEAPRAEISQCIRRQCTGGLCARRGLSAAQRVGLSIGLSALVVALIAVITAGHEHAAGAWRAALFGAVGWGVVMLAVLLLGLARPAGWHLSRVVRLGLALALPIAFLAYLTASASVGIPLGEFVHAGGPAGAVRCGGYALLFGGLATAAMLFIWRGTDPWNPGVSGALAGLVGGLTGAVAVGCACPTGSTWHLWLGHGTVVLLLLISGSLAGRRWLAP
jgi:hypothetical protein